MEALADLPIFPDGMPLEEAQAVLDEQGLSDGLPLVPPTKARLDAMLAGVNAPNKSYGQLLPLFGDLTTAAVAYNCVLAGCERDALAVVLTAAEACLEPTFNLLGILTTTGTPAPCRLQSSRHPSSGFAAVRQRSQLQHYFGRFPQKSGWQYSAWRCRRLAPRCHRDCECA